MKIATSSIEIPDRSLHMAADAIKIYKSYATQGEGNTPPIHAMARILYTIDAITLPDPRIVWQVAAKHVIPLKWTPCLDEPNWARDNVYRRLWLPNDTAFMSYDKPQEDEEREQDIQVLARILRVKTDDRPTMACVVQLYNVLVSQPT